MANSIFLILPAAYIFYTGVMAFFKGKMGTAYDMKYTQESIKKLSRPHGILSMLISIFLIITDLAIEEVIPKNISYVGLGILVVLFIISFVVAKKTLVKLK